MKKITIKKVVKPRAKKVTKKVEPYGFGDPVPFCGLEPTPANTLSLSGVVPMGIYSGGVSGIWNCLDPWFPSSQMIDPNKTKKPTEPLHLPDRKKCDGLTYEVPQKITTVYDSMTSFCFQMPPMEKIQTTSTQCQVLCGTHFIDHEVEKEKLDPEWKEILNSPDAMKWAAKFHKENPAIDKELMHTWFANAMMAMHDHIENRNKKEKLNDTWVYVLSNAQTPDVIALYHDEPSKEQVNRDYALSLGKDLELAWGDEPATGQAASYNCLLTRHKVGSTNRLRESVDITKLTYDRYF